MYRDHIIISCSSVCQAHTAFLYTYMQRSYFGTSSCKLRTPQIQEEQDLQQNSQLLEPLYSRSLVLVWEEHLKYGNNKYMCILTEQPISRAFVFTWPPDWFLGFGVGGASEIW